VNETSTPLSRRVVTIEMESGTLKYKNKELPQLRNSTSQPQLPREEWNTSLRDYGRTKVLNKQPDQPAKLLSQSTTVEIFSTMKNMDRPLTAPEKELIPRHQVQNEYYHHGGMTMSTEPRSNYLEGQAELGVLKAILNREGILTQLLSTVKKVEKKFQSDIIGLLDQVRQTSLEVVTAIENWRSIKVFEYPLPPF
jgi:hypothetical protein